MLTDPAPGFALGASMRRARFSAGVAGRFDLPVESEHEATDATRTRVTTRTSLVLGEVHACAHLRPRGLTPFLCAFVQAGALRGAASGIATAKEDVSAYLAAGPRLGATLPLSESIALDARVDVPFALTTVELRVDDRALWTSPTLGAVAGAGMTFSLP